MAEEPPHEEQNGEEDDHLLKALTKERKMRKDAEERAKAKDGEIESVKSQLAALRAQLEAEAGEKSGFDAKIREKEAAIKGLTAEIKEKEEAILQRDAALEEKNKLIAEREGAIRERDAALEEKDAIIQQTQGKLSEFVAIIKERDEALAHLNEKLKGEEGKVSQLDSRINAITTQNDELVQAMNDLKKERDNLAASCDTLEKRSLHFEEEARGLKAALDEEKRRNVKDEELKAEEDKLEKMKVELETREKHTAEMEAKLEGLEAELHSREKWLDNEGEEYKKAKAKLEEERKNNEEFDARLKRREDEVNELKRALQADFQKILDKNEELRQKDEQLAKLSKDYEELKVKKFEEAEILKAKHAIGIAQQALEEKKKRLSEWEKELEIRERWLDREADEINKLKAELASAPKAHVEEAFDQSESVQVAQPVEVAMTQGNSVSEMPHTADAPSTDAEPKQTEQHVAPAQQDEQGLKYLQPEPQPERREDIDAHPHTPSMPVREEDDEGQEARDPRLGGMLVKRKVMKVVKSKKPIKTLIQR